MLKVPKKPLNGVFGVKKDKKGRNLPFLLLNP
jgi:hypothetical protein